jgi:uncharacterized protein YvpB
VDARSAPVWLTVLVTTVALAACGGVRPVAVASQQATEPAPPSAAELAAVGARLIPQVPAYGYYVECVNFPENGAAPASGENDYSACPITPRLRSVMEYAPPGVSPKLLGQGHFCPCQQNPSADRTVKATPAGGGGILEIALYAGHVKVEALVVTQAGHLLVDDVAAKGDVDAGPVAFTEKPPTPGAATARPTPVLGNGGSMDRTLDVPWFKQAFPLSCEAASLRMALAYRGIPTTDAAILDLIGSDLRSAAVDADGSMRWGDPYQTFVGSPNGSEVALTGYGTYYPPIVKAAAALGGRVLRSGEGVPAADVYQAVRDGHPVVAWVTYHWVSAPRHDYTSFGGRSIPYAGPIEHAVTVVGVTSDSVYINNPWSGQEWVSRRTFEAAYETYNRMAVILQ